MNDNDHHMFSQKEVIEALLQSEGINEGHWALIIKFGFAAINAGPDEKNIVPTAMIGVTGFGLERANENTKGVVVDASSLSNARKARKKPTPKAAAPAKPATKAKTPKQR